MIQVQRKINCCNEALKLAAYPCSKSHRVAGPLFMSKTEHKPCHRSLTSIFHMLNPHMVLTLGRKPFPKHWICSWRTLSSKEGGWILAPKFTGVVTLGKFLDSLSSTVILLKVVSEPARSGWTMPLLLVISPVFTCWQKQAEGEANN